MNEIRKAEVLSLMIEEGYTCTINFYVLDNDGIKEFIQGFGGKKFHTYQDYEIWKNGIENIINRKFSDGKGAMIKVIITSNEDILGIGNLEENYWIVRETVEETNEKGRRVFKFKTTKEEIDKFFEKNNIEHTTGKSETNNVER